MRWIRETNGGGAEGEVFPFFVFGTTPLEYFVLLRI